MVATLKASGVRAESNGTTRGFAWNGFHRRALRRERRDHLAGTSRHEERPPDSQAAGEGRRWTGELAVCAPGSCGPGQPATLINGLVRRETAAGSLCWAIAAPHPAGGESAGGYFSRKPIPEQLFGRVPACYWRGWFSIPEQFAPACLRWAHARRAGPAGGVGVVRGFPGEGVPSRRPGRP